VQDSYVVLKDSRMFISSRTAVSSVDNSAVSSSRSAVASCETERGKRHVYLKKTECIFSDPHVHIVDADICIRMLIPKRRNQIPETLESPDFEGTRECPLLHNKVFREKRLFNFLFRDLGEKPIDDRARSHIFAGSQAAAPRPTSPEPRNNVMSRLGPRCQATL